MAGCHCEFRGMAGCTPSGIERLGRLQPRPDSPPSVFLVTGRTAPFLTSQACPGLLPSKCCGASGPLSSVTPSPAPGWGLPSGSSP